MDQLKEKMYGLAYQYKRTKLWSHLGDDELFAVRHADGAISYCSVLGSLGQQFALNIYTGPDGFASYLRLIDIAEMTEPFYDTDDPFLKGEMRHAQKCLSCSLENRADIFDEEAKEVRAYAKTHGMKLNGKNMYPVFLDFTPGEHLWEIESVRDREHLCDALEAAIHLSDLFEQHALNPFDMMSYRISQEILLFSRKNDTWEIGKTLLPEKRFAYPAPRLTDELKQHRIREMKKTEIWQCGTLFSPSGIGKPEEGERPFYPLILLAVTEDPAFVRPIHMGRYNETAAFLTALADHIIDGGHAPKIIRCADERCSSLLEDFCQKTGIRLESGGNLEAYQEAAHHLFSDMSDPDLGPQNDEEVQDMMLEMLRDISRMSDAELRRMPEGLLRALKGLPLDQHMPELLERLKKL